MMIAHESKAPGMDVPAPFRRTLKVLLSPAIHPELKSMALGLTILPPGGRSDDHEHVEGEMFYVVSGEGQIRVGEETEAVTPGTAVWGPPGMNHQLMNDSNEILKILWVLSPPGREAEMLEEQVPTA